MSGRSFRQVRTHYSNEVTTRLARRGIEILRGWGDHVGVGDSGFEPVGYLLAVAGDQADGCAANVALGNSLGVRTELVPAERLQEIEPLLAADGLACGAWEPDSGLIDPVKVTLSATVAAQMSGARTLFGSPVRALRTSGDRVTGVVTGDGDIHAGTVVLAVGPWAPRLLAGTGIDLGMRLQTLELSVLRRPAGVAGLSTAVTHAPSGLVARCDSGPFAVAVAYPAEAVEPEFPQDARVAADAEPRLRRALTAAVPALAPAEVITHDRGRLRRDAGLASDARPVAGGRRPLPGGRLLRPRPQARPRGRRGRRRRTRWPHARHRHQPAAPGGGAPAAALRLRARCEGLAGRGSLHRRDHRRNQRWSHPEISVAARWQPAPRA